MDKKYFYSLDLFRGFCGYGVAICHLHAFIFNNIFMEYLSILFVEFFFILSGFVLYPQLLKVLGKKNNLLIFYQRRWIRTIPLFVILLISVSILTNNFFSLDFFKYLVFIQKSIPNFVTTDYYPIVWSLSIEEFFYLLFPLLLINLNKFNFIKVIMLFLLIITLIKFILASDVDANFYRTGTFFRFDAILFGFILAHYKNILFKYNKIIIILAISSLIFYMNSYSFFISKKEITFSKIIFILFMQVVSGLIMFSFLSLEKFIINKTIKDICLLVSSQTYSIYLFHIILIYIFQKTNISLPIMNFIYILLLFFVSTLVYKFFEKPLLELRPKIY